MFEHPLGHPGERITAHGRNRAVNVLRLPSIALRRHDHAAGDDVGGCRPVLLAHDVQRGIDSRGGAGARDDLAVLHEEHVGVHSRARVHAGEAIGIHPVRGRAPALEDAGLGERECPAADAEHPGAARLGSADRVEESLVDGLDAVGGHRDEVGVCGNAQILSDHHVVSETRLDRARCRGRDGEVELRPAGVAAIDAEHLADDSELERGDPGDRQ